MVTKESIGFFFHKNIFKLMNLKIQLLAENFHLIHIFVFLVLWMELRSCSNYNSLSIPDYLMILEGPSKVSSLIWHSKGNVLVVKKRLLLAMMIALVWYSNNELSDQDSVRFKN